MLQEVTAAKCPDHISARLDHPVAYTVCGRREGAADSGPDVSVGVALGFLFLLRLLQP